MRKPGGLVACTAVAVLAFGALVTAGCGPGDPREAVLKERARWHVELSDWLQTDDGLRATVRIWGPPKSSIDKLSVKLMLADEAGETVAQVWQTFDLTRSERGAPTDYPVSIKRPDLPKIDGVGLDTVAVPSAEDEAQIAELAGI
jgi:hypothetical protein